jgi:nucleotide-binding universal stress UspA family protein
MLAERSILCPVDLSKQSGQALLWASAIAHYRGAELTVLSVLEPLLAQAAGIRLGVDLTRTEVKPALREFVEATLPEGVHRASQLRIEVTAGDPSEAILQTGRRLKAGLIVMGTHGLGGFRKLILGSTTEQVLRRTEWPVLAVPPGTTSVPAVEHPGVRLRRILVATDFRESAMAAMQWAGDLASDFSVPLVLAHIVEPVIVPVRFQELVADFESERVASGRRMLARLSAAFRHTHSECVVSVGRPADTIASLAVEHGVGLVIMGLTDPDDSKRRHPGSIAYRVLRMGHVPVVVVPALGRNLRATDEPRGVPGQSSEHLAESSQNTDLH